MATKVTKKSPLVEKIKKSVRERDMEQLANSIIDWFSGTDADGFSPAGRSIVWFKFVIMFLALTGIIIPFCSIFLGLTIAHIFTSFALQTFLVILLVFGTSVLLCFRYIRTTVAIVVATAVILSLTYFGIFDPIGAAQWIMIVGILLFGIPALLVVGFGGNFIALLIHKMFWNKTPAWKIQIIVHQYFSAVIWLFVLGEAAILFGVNAPMIALGIGAMALIGWILMSRYWGRDLGVSRFLAFTFQIGLIVWALGVALPTPTSLYIFGHDLRHEWGFYHLKPLAMHQQELDQLEEKLATDEGKRVVTTLEEAKSLSDAGSPEEARKKLEELKKGYSDNALFPRLFEWGKRTIEEQQQR